VKITAEQRKKIKLLQLRKQHRDKLLLAFDSRDIHSRPTKTQMDIIESDYNINYVVASNRGGKSQLGARILAWWFEDNHPYKERPAKWGDGSITLLLVGRVGEQMDSELWSNKLEPFLEPGSYKVVRAGNSISRIEHRKSGNRMIFISHHDADQARQKAQAYTAQVVWLDEMPTKVGVLNELRARVFDSDGFMYGTFTPLLKNNEIKKIVDSPSKRSKKWFISVLDNPKFADKKREDIIEEFRAMSASESEFRARLYGDWMSADSAVFTYDSERNWTKMQDYDPQIWPHVAVVDPAVSGMAGLSVWAREPTRDKWYCVMAKYVKGDAFSLMVPLIEKMIEPFNIIKRIADCNPSGFYVEAKVQGIQYVPVTDKAYNKENMIDACNSALATGLATLTPGSEILADELLMCSRSEDNPDKIIKASKYHTADTFRYFIHLKPKFREAEPAVTPENSIKRAWKKKLEDDSKRATTVMKKMNRRQGRRRWA